LTVAAAIPATIPATIPAMIKGLVAATEAVSATNPLIIAGLSGRLRQPLKLLATARSASS
jgi:hypothetical protein